MIILLIITGISGHTDVRNRFTGDLSFLLFLISYFLVVGWKLSSVSYRYVMENATRFFDMIPFIFGWPVSIERSREWCRTPDDVSPSKFSRGGTTSTVSILVVFIIQQRNSDRSTGWRDGRQWQYLRKHAPGHRRIVLSQEEYSRIMSEECSYQSF